MPGCAGCSSGHDDALCLPEPAARHDAFSSAKTRDQPQVPQFHAARQLTTMSVSENCTYGSFCKQVLAPITAALVELESMCPRKHSEAFFSFLLALQARLPREAWPYLKLQSCQGHLDTDRPVRYVKIQSDTVQ